MLNFSINFSWLDFFPLLLGPGTLAVAPAAAGVRGSGMEGEGPLAPRLPGRVADVVVGPPGALLPGFITGPGALGAVPIGGWGSLGVPTGPPGALDIAAEAGLMTFAWGATAASWSATVGAERSIPGGGRRRGAPGSPMGGGGPGKLF